MALFDTFRFTAAGAVALPKKGMFLTKLIVHGGTLPGAFSIRYDGINLAFFPAPVSGRHEYPVKWGPLSGTLAATIFAFSAAGHPAVVEMQFSDVPGNGPPIESYRASEFRRVDAGAVTADISVDFTGGDNRPKGAVVLISASAGRIRYPATGGLQMDVEASPEEFLPDVMPAPTLEENASLTLSVITDGAATIGAYVYF